MSWRNGEGYPDPTAEMALGNLIREEKRKKKRNGGNKYAGTEHCVRKQLHGEEVVEQDDHME